MLTNYVFSEFCAENQETNEKKVVKKETQKNMKSKSGKKNRMCWRRNLNISLKFYRNNY